MRNNQAIGQHRKKQLIDAAVQAIAKCGVIDVTITDVAEIAGLSRGIVNFYFVSKDALIEQTLAHVLQSAMQGAKMRLARAENASADEQLRVWMTAQFESDWCNQKRLQVWLSCIGLSATRKPFARIFSAYEQAWLEVTQPLLDARQAPLSAGHLFQALQGAQLSLARHWSLTAREEASAYLYSLCSTAGVAKSAPHKPKAAAKPVEIQPVITAKPDPKARSKKPAEPAITHDPAQLDFGELFSKNK